MTPNDIEILIHCHVSPSPHSRIDAPAVAGSLASLEVNGLIQKIDTHGGYRATARGRAHIETLCKTPWPTQKWVDHFGAIIETEAP